jgi:hypothetical protein
MTSNTCSSRRHVSRQFANLFDCINNNLASYLGLASISVPAGFTSAGLPVGVDFLGRPVSERTLLGVAYAFEQAALLRRPPASTPPLPGESIPEPSRVALSLWAVCSVFGFALIQIIVSSAIV